MKCYAVLCFVLHRTFAQSIVVNFWIQLKPSIKYISMQLVCLWSQILTHPSLIYKVSMFHLAQCNIVSNNDGTAELNYYRINNTVCTVCTVCVCAVCTLWMIIMSSIGWQCELFSNQNHFSPLHSMHSRLILCANEYAIESIFIFWFHFYHSATGFWGKCTRRWYNTRSTGTKLNFRWKRKVVATQ